MKQALLALTAAALLAAAVPFAVRAEVEQEGNLRVSFGGKIAPHKLPRVGTAPVSVSISGDITTTDNSTPPQLRTITMAINRHGRLDDRGLPACGFHQIQPTSTTEALEACSASLIGKGFFEAHVALPEQSPFPSSGKVVAFNGTLHGRPVIFAHIWGTRPLPTSFTLPFYLRRHQRGTYATLLVAHLPHVAAQWGYVSGLSLTLTRRYRYRGRPHSFISAGCPAPRGFPGTSFDFARAAFGFEGGTKITSTMTRSCAVRG
jgi:hypothetical protein